MRFIYTVQFRYRPVGSTQLIPAIATDQATPDHTYINDVADFSLQTPKSI